MDVQTDFRWVWGQTGGWLTPPHTHIVLSCPLLTDFLSHSMKSESSSQGNTQDSPPKFSSEAVSLTNSHCQLAITGTESPRKSGVRGGKSVLTPGFRGSSPRPLASLCLDGGEVEWYGRNVWWSICSSHGGQEAWKRKKGSRTPLRHTSSDLSLLSTCTR